MTVSTDEEEDRNEIHKLLERPGVPIGPLVATGLWIFLVLVVAYLKCVWVLEANAIGDFVAGAFAPVAFAWLILGYLRQGHELRLQSAELALTRKEFAAQTDVFRQQLDQDRTQLRLSALERDIETAPLKMVEFFETLKPFNIITHKSKRQSYHTNWGRPPKRDQTDEIRSFASGFSSIAQTFVGDEGATLLTTLAMIDTEAAATIRSKAEDLLRWDQAFRSADEPMIQTYWEIAGQKYGLDLLVGALSKILKEPDQVV